MEKMCCFQQAEVLCSYTPAVSLWKAFLSQSNFMYGTEALDVKKLNKYF